MALLTQPELAYKFVGEIASNGRLYYDGESLSIKWHGWIWIGESLVMLMLNPLSVAGSTTNKVFCEKCNNWLDHSFEFQLIPVPNGSEITTNPEFFVFRDSKEDSQINPEKIPSLISWFFYREIIKTFYVKAKIQHCNHCHETSTAQFEVVEVKVTEEKIDEFVNEVIDEENSKETTHRLEQKHLISKEFHEAFRSKNEAFLSPGTSHWG